MSRIEFVVGIKCNKCGNIITSSSKIKSELCQKCGADIFYEDVFTRDYEITKNAKYVKLKITHKLFKKIVEVIEEQ